MATYMNTMTSPGNALGRHRKQRKRSIGALVAGVSLATSLTVGSGLSGLLPFLGEKAGAASTLKGLVYVDLNRNGVQDLSPDVTKNEFGWANVKVTAFAKNGTLAGSANTLADGTWQIVTDAQGPFRVEFSNYASSKIASGNNLGGTSVQFPTGSTPVNFTLFGKVNGLGSLEDIAYETLQIGNRVWRDSNGNGIQDAEEPGISGVLVKLVDEGGIPAVDVGTGAVLPDVVTNSNGEYYFDHLGGGRTYRVVIDPAQPALAGLTLTPAFSTKDGGDTLSDSNGFYVVKDDPETFLGGKPIAIGTIVARAVTGTSGQNDHSFDFGLVAAALKLSIGDYVFVDANRNGIQDAGDTPVQGATVTLLDANGVAIAGKSAVTLADGLYLFDGLDAGTYKVRVTRPAGSNVTPTAANAGTDDAVDSDFTAETVDRVVSGAINLTADDLTVDSGWLSPISDPGIAKIGDTVFLDANRNGIQDEGETGLQGVSVTLQTCIGADIATLVTVENGRYEFTALPGGSYRIKFTLPAGYDFTQKGVGADRALDSNADTVTGVSDCVTLAVGESNLTVDAGLVAKSTGTTTTTTPGATTSTTTPGVTTTTTTTPGATTTTTTPGATTTTTTPGVTTTTTTPGVTTTTTPGVTTTTTTTPPNRTARLGDRVFFDANRNGTQDNDEVGVVGAKVNLETCAGVAIASTITIADGRYQFANLPAGQYRVRFELPLGYDFTFRGVGNDVGLDSDADVATGVTGCVTLAAGEFNATVDAGIIQRTIIVLETTTTTTVAPTTTRPATTLPPTTVPVATGCIGDKVFEGKAGDRDGKGIPGISLVLVLEDGTTVTTVTDANGLYRFCTLKPGTYTVRVTVPPAGATNIYTLDGKNNNATGVVLAGGKDNLDADFGYDLGKNVQVKPVVIEQGPDFPETPVLTPSVTGSNGTRQGLGGLALILTGVGMVGLIRSRKEHWN